jgi:phosphatidylserine/phosphatidylglycerophosphate/cardiolipin synthase-like enzyme
MPTPLPPAPDSAIAAFDEAISPELVGRACHLQVPPKINPVPSFNIKDEFIAYASPDATFDITRRLVEASQKSILVGIYDFTATYMQDLFVRAMQRGVGFALMLDLDGRTGEQAVYDELQKLGADTCPAPSCASDNAQYFASSHEKVTVIDGAVTLVQSGNFSENSIPNNADGKAGSHGFVPGNRDMGVAVRSKSLATFFDKLLRADMALERAGTPAAGGGPTPADAAEVDLLLAAPPKAPPKLFPSKSFKPKTPIPVMPVLSPDNYMRVIPALLESATKSIVIEQQYIRGAQPEIVKLLDSIKRARSHHPKLEIRIVLARPFPGKRFDKEAKEIRQLGTDFGFKLGTHVRILNPRYFVHCHNKLIVVDGEQVLVSSQNWSDSAVIKNREAGLLINYPALARYFTDIFDVDWMSGLRTLPRPKAEALAPAAFAAGGMVRLNWGDYAEV